MNNIKEQIKWDVTVEEKIEALANFIIANETYNIGDNNLVRYFELSLKQAREEATRETK